MSEVIGRWYSIQTLTGKENVVLDSINNKVEVDGLQEKILDVVMKTDEITEFKNGKKKKRIVKKLPSYIFIKMVFDRDLMYELSNIEGVMGFVSNSKGPIRIPESEMKAIVEQTESQVYDVEFKVNSAVKIINGPFNTFTGTVNEIYPDKARMKVTISVFGRNTPVELDFKEVVPVTE